MFTLQNSSPRTDPLKQALGNPELSIPTLVHSYAPIPSGKPQIFHYLINLSTLKTFEELVTEPTCSAPQKILYFQLRHFYIINKSRLKIFDTF